MNRVEVFIISKKSGNTLHKYSILGIEDEIKDELFSGFLSALNKISKEVGFPDVSLIRFGNLEARFSPGRYIFTVLIIEIMMPLTGLMTERLLNGLAQEINSAFENKYMDYLEALDNNNVPQTEYFDDFRNIIDQIINRIGNEVNRFYQKSLIQESINQSAHDWNIIDELNTLLKRISQGKDILEDLEPLEKEYKSVTNAIKKINFNYAPVWEIFVIPLYFFKD